jgi:phosphatidylserine decarboxylase
MFKSILIPIHKAGFPFIFIFVIISLAICTISIGLGLIGAILTAWCIYFFRNPPRIIPTRTGLIVSPADGIVQMISKAVPPEELEMGTSPCNRIAVFMNVFNVHVNRSPVSGTISKKSYRAGKFLNASFDKASELNERMSLKAKMNDGTEVGFVQIAGLIARRILCNVNEGDTIAIGEEFGLIRFGSRVDIYLPECTEPLVCLGQTTIAGETILADLLSKESARYGNKI